MYPQILITMKRYKCTSIDGVQAHISAAAQLLVILYFLATSLAENAAGTWSGALQSLHDSSQANLTVTSPTLS